MIHPFSKSSKKPSTDLDSYTYGSADLNFGDGVTVRPVRKNRDFGRSVSVTKCETSDIHEERFIQSLDDSTNKLTSLFSSTFRLYNREPSVVYEADDDETTQDNIVDCTGSGITNNHIHSIISNIFWRHQLVFNSFSFGDKVVSLL